MPNVDRVPRRRFPAICALLATLAAAGGPAHAENRIGYGTPTVDERYNDTFRGYVQLSFGTNLTDIDRPVSSDCRFATEGQPNSARSILVIETNVVALPFVGHGSVAVAPARVGVRCELTVGRVRIGSAEATAPGAAAAQQQVSSDVLVTGPLKLCSYPVVHWSDDVVQTGSGFCVTSS